MKSLSNTLTWIGGTILFVLVLIELAVRFRWELSPVYEHLFGDTILYG